MANYTLFAFTFNNAAHKALRADAHCGATLIAATDSARHIKGGEGGTIAEALPQQDLIVGGNKIGVMLGRFYDDRIVSVTLQPRETAFILRNNIMDDMAHVSGDAIADVFSRFSAAQSDREHYLVSHGCPALVPIYTNKTEVPQTVEIHQTWHRVKGDPKTVWQRDGKTEWFRLVAN